ncbi:MAG: ABC transporter substrate-binding protein [Hyphomicrobiales bacterium]
MKIRAMLAASALALSFVFLAADADARELRWAAAGDSLTLDPHAQNEGPTHTMSHQMYEPLLQRDMEAQIIPALATEWAPLDDDPTVWEFKLRQGVTFHDGAPFTADDVVFSLNRAMHPDSGMKTLLASVEEVTKVDDHTVHISTEGPNPLLPNNLTNLFIMNEAWATEHGVEKPQNFAAGEENYAVRNTNGTGAFKLVSREPDSRTVLEANEDYWGKDEFPLEVTDMIFTPIQSASTRVAALLSGEVDLILDVPVQDLERVDEGDGLDVRTAPQNRTVFFGMNVADETLENADADGNPFADVKVRQALDMVLDREAIQQVVMRGHSAPTGVIMPPFVNGWTEELDEYPDVDLEKAKALMEEAGYGDGFTVTLHCPNDRYINDEAICQAAAGMFGRIGVDVDLEAQAKERHFPLLENLETDFYMLGWGVPTFDSEYVFNFLYHTRTEEYGGWNATRYSNEEMDEKIRSLATMTDLEARDALIAEIWEEAKADLIYIPIHHQVLNWGMKSDIEFEVQPEDQPHFKFLTFSN